MPPNQALTASGLRDEHVAAEYPLGAVLVFLLQSLISLLLRLPVAAIGTVLSFIPYRISIHVGRPNDLDKRATFSLFSSVLLFPVFWLVQGWAIGAATARWVDPSWAWPLAIAAVVLAPLCGVSTLVFYDNVWRLLFMLKGWFRMRRGGKVSASLIAQRREIRDELVELVALYQAETGETGETR